MRTYSDLGERWPLWHMGLDLICEAPPTFLLLHLTDFPPPRVLSDHPAPPCGRGCVPIGDDVWQELLRCPDLSAVTLSFVSGDEVDLWSKSRRWLHSWSPLLSSPLSEVLPYRLSLSSLFAFLLFSLPFFSFYSPENRCPHHYLLLIKKKERKNPYKFFFPLSYCISVFLWFKETNLRVIRELCASSSTSPTARGAHFLSVHLQAQKFIRSCLWATPVVFCGLLIGTQWPRCHPDRYTSRSHVV